MAGFHVDASQWEGLALDWAELAKLPDQVIDDMLIAGGDVMKPYAERAAISMIQGPYATGMKGTAGHVKRGRPKKSGKGGRALYITFSGSRKRGNTVTRNAEIAFFNEFGTRKKGQPPRQFVHTATEQGADPASEAEEKVLDDYITKRGF